MVLVAFVLGCSCGCEVDLGSGFLIGVVGAEKALLFWGDGLGTKGAFLFLLSGD